MSRDLGRHFTTALVDRWNVGACVTSTQAFAEGSSSVLTAGKRRVRSMPARLPLTIEGMPLTQSDDRDALCSAFASGEFI